MNLYELTMKDGSREWVRAYSAKAAFQCWRGYVRQFKKTCRYGRDDVVAMIKIPDDWRVPGGGPGYRR